MKERMSMKDLAYEFIKNKIINNEFKSGQYLEEKMLCEMIGVSRTPVREAVSLLESEGFVTSKANKGIFVSTLDMKTSKELFQARAYIEPIILELAWKNLETDKLEKFIIDTKDFIKNKDYKSLNEIDYEFHNYINSCCNNTVLLNISYRLQDQFQRVRTLNYYDDQRIEGGAYEHLDIIKLIKQNKLDEAKVAMKNHVYSTQTYFFMSFFKE
ncbi:MAG: GntR family transcriptional regulator [Peptoniphilaceae bacterium]|nr:GntR family transcriptional regulator [Peptoniphilaceae bacterium]MDD7383591.1 GntR family transcriptional regulator [Peptoniphilaceae bacterium]MDY3738763.1 GntR family transcriptional regulator [Peptoniphilaceae bacterium]